MATTTPSLDAGKLISPRSSDPYCQDCASKTNQINQVSDVNFTLRRKLESSERQIREQDQALAAMREERDAGRETLSILQTERNKLLQDCADLADKLAQATQPSLSDPVGPVDAAVDTQTAPKWSYQHFQDIYEWLDDLQNDRDKLKKRIKRLEKSQL